MKNIKRLVTLLLAAAMVLSMIMIGHATEEASPFGDVAADAWYAEAVAYCREQGWMSGTSATEFSPDGEMTRAMVVTVLYRAAGEPVVSGTLSFTDTQSGQWYSNAVLWANAQGIVRGYGNGLFGTTDPITREQLDIIIRRYQGENPVWTGDPALNVPATRAEAAVAFYGALKEDEPETPAQAGKVLIAYFSATNNTEGVANHIKATLGDNADLYEIVPETPYTSADLNYTNNSSRANREQNDPTARPAIADSCKVANMEDYDVVFLGYPIWHGQAPKIMYTFVESYDLSGKTIVPFCTSASSGIGSSATNLAAAATGATWLSGSRFSGSVSQSTVADWVNGLDLPEP